MLHAPTASGARFNTSGRDWTCFAECHTEEGYQRSYEYYKSQHVSKRKGRPPFDIPTSAARISEHTAQYAHNKNKRAKGKGKKKPKRR
jgi:hypothetical protein